MSKKDTKFWRTVEKSAREVENWPDWKLIPFMGEEGVRKLRERQAREKATQ